MIKSLAKSLAWGVLACMAGATATFIGFDNFWIGVRIVCLAATGCVAILCIGAALLEFVGV